ncbi:MAG TPA: pilus assembly protein PilP [Burkholderiales bacterium]|jgi:type IV pilus assembly protein PilP|nr:pilus assembly protein PilP [Burkholderiales bacterium]HWP87319.1 pilus assembly protein PilP [Burkholderiales bacterium]
MSRRLWLPIVLCCGLAACGGEQYSDLRQFVKDSEKLPHGRIPPLPDVKPYEPFTYDAYNLIDPFKPRKIEPPKTQAGGGVQPDLARRKEPLEAYPLENLRMVGTLQQNKQTYALVKSPDNNLFRVKSGNYLGQNFGLITTISESTIKLKEIVQDSGGDWTERVSTLTLAEEAGK